MKRLLSTVFAVCVCAGLWAQTAWQPADPDATPEAKQLFARLVNIQKKGTMYGHQDDLMTGRTWWYQADNYRSDTKDAVGDYPGVIGFELGEIELGGQRSLDSVSFVQMTERARWFHKQGGIITVSWHAVNPITAQWPGIKEPNGAGSAWEVAMLSSSGLNAVQTILPGGENHAMFNVWLDRLARFFLTWRDDEGKLIPFIFRPWHEHSGNFFWWGRTRCYDEEFAELWRYTVKYLREKELHNILYAYNTDKVYSAEEYLAGYPGDEYIDMLSIDWYGQGEEFNKVVDEGLRFTTALAAQKNKLHALSECGPISADLQKILSKYESSYILTWRHAPPRGGRRFTPPTPAQIAAMSPEARAAYEARMRQPTHEDLLKIMDADANYLFLNDIKNIK